MEKESTFKIPRTEQGYIYYLIEDNFEVNSFTERNDNRDNEYYEKYNYFTSENQAKRFASKMQDYLVELWKEEMEKK